MLIQRRAFVAWCCLLTLTSSCEARTPVSDASAGIKASATFAYPGDIYVGVFIDLHKSLPFPGTNQSCGELNPAAVQQLWAAIWAIDTLNNQTEASMPKLGLKVYDTCDSPVSTLQHTMGFLQKTVTQFPGSCEPQDAVPMIGVIGIGEAEALRPALGLLAVYSVPFVLATPSAASGLPAQPNVLTTAPTMASIVQAVGALLAELRWRTIYAISSSPAAVQDLTLAAIHQDVTIVQTLTLTRDTIGIEAIEGILANKKANSPGVVVLMLEPNEIDILVRVLSGRDIVNEITWIVAIPSLDRKHILTWGSVLKRGFLLTPHSAHLQDFSTSFLGTLAGRAKGRPLAVDAYLQKEYRCTGDNKTGGKPCSNLTLSDLQKGYRQDPNVPFVSKAVSALAAALRMVQIDRCKLSARCVRQDLGGQPNFKEILTALMKLSFTVQGNEPMEVEGTRLKFTTDGKLVFKHFDIYAFNGSSQAFQVGWYSDNVGLNLNAAWRQRALSTRVYQTRSGAEAVEAYEEGAVGNEAGRKSWVSVLHFSPRAALAGRGWATAVVVASGLGLLATAYVFIYVMVKICDRTLTGNQFLGVLLLLGVASTYATCALFVLPPSEALCNWRLFLHSASYALCYGVLFVKVMQLRSLVYLGLGGRLSHLNQAFTLLFIVGLQVALSIQWSVLMRPMAGILESGEPRCLTTKTDFACAQAYVLLLLLLTGGYALYTRHIRRNHNEGRWVLVAALASVPVWVCWMAAFLAADDGYQEPAVCAGLIASATLLLAVVFGPKMRTLGGRGRGASAGHKDGSSTNSTATVFSLTHDLEAVGKTAKMFPSSLFAESLLRNPLYDFRDKRLDTIPEKAENRFS